MATGLEALGSARQRVWRAAGFEYPFAKAVTTDVTLTDGDSRCVSVDSTDETIDLTLPASPYDGMEWRIFDGAAAGSWHTNNVTINGNGNSIALAGSAAAATLVCSERSGWVTLRYRATSDLWHASPAVVSGGETFTNPIISGGLTAQGSTDNDFSGSTGAFYTSTGHFGWTGGAGKQFSIVQGVATTGSTYALKLTGGAHTTRTASTEANDVYFDLSRTVQFATGALTTQRAFLVDAPTYGFVGASTITDAATVAIEAAPVAGTNATITRSHALWVQGGSVNLARSTVSQATNINTAVTCSGASGVITTQSATTAAVTAESGFVVTNTACHANSVVIARVVAYAGTLMTNGIPDVHVSAVSAGSFTLKVMNLHATNALSGTMTIHFHVL